MASPQADLEALLRAYTRRESAQLDEARRVVLRQYRRGLFDELAGKLRAALDQPISKRSGALPDLLRSLDAAATATRTPPKRIEGIIREAVRDRLLSLDQLAAIQNPALKFNESAELQARAVDKQRQAMNGYWANEQARWKNDVSRTIRQALRQDLDPERAADLLQQRLGVGRSRAVLIAQDQMLTAAARADASRQQALGIDSYIWRTREDGRVRPEHAARDGHRYSWSAGSERPGQAIRCRCRALPVVKLAAPALRDTGAGGSPIGSEGWNPQRTDGLTPAGSRIGAKGRLPREAGPLRDAIGRALQAIDAVHGDGPLPPLRFRLVRNLDGAGQYRYRAFPRARIDIDYAATQPEYSSIHEIGHVLHDRVFGFAKVPEISAAIEASDLFDQLKRLRQNPYREVNGLRFRLRLDQVDYALSELELFARAYAQYISDKANVPMLKEQVAFRRGPRALYPSQWTDEDFRGIAEAFDRVFLERGWLTRSPQ